MGGFANDEFKTFCLNLNICTTAAKIPWSNDLVERHNVFLKLIVCKTIEEINCDLDVAVVWALSAKILLKMVMVSPHPNQLAFGKSKRFKCFCKYFW